MSTFGGRPHPILPSVIPAQAGIQRPKTPHSPLDSRLCGNDGNRGIGESMSERSLLLPLRPLAGGEGRGEVGLNRKE